MADGVELARDQLLAVREKLLAQVAETTGELRRIEAALRYLGGCGVSDRRRSRGRREAGGPSERAMVALTELGRPSTVPQVVEQMVRRGWAADVARPDKSVFRALNRAISTGEVCKTVRGKYMIVPGSPQPKDA